LTLEIDRSPPLGESERVKAIDTKTVYSFISLAEDHEPGVDRLELACEHQAEDGEQHEQCVLSKCACGDSVLD
jgi:hypothetical protein